MSKFYEMRLFTGAGFVSLIIISFIVYIGGRILPLRLRIIPIPLIAGLIISIYYIIYGKQ